MRGACALTTLEDCIPQGRETSKVGKKEKETEEKKPQRRYVNIIKKIRKVCLIKDTNEMKVLYGTSRSFMVLLGPSLRMWSHIFRNGQNAYHNREPFQGHLTLILR